MGRERGEPAAFGRSHRPDMDLLQQVNGCWQLNGLRRKERRGSESIIARKHLLVTERTLPRRMRIDIKRLYRLHQVMPMYPGNLMVRARRTKIPLLWSCLVLALIALVPGYKSNFIDVGQRKILEQTAGGASPSSTHKFLSLEDTNSKSALERWSGKPEVSMLMSESSLVPQVSPYQTALGQVQLASIISVAPSNSLEAQRSNPLTKEALVVSESNQATDNMITSASKKKKKMMKKKKKMEKKHKEWKKGKKHKKKKYESKKKKGGSMKKKKGKKEKKKWGMEKKGHKKKGNFKKKKWGSKKKMKKGHKKGKKGHKMLKDKGHKKKGFKKVYHKEEWGKKKKWHDIKREKKWNTKQKKWKKKWHQEKGKKYKGKHMKKYHKKNKHGKKYKKEKKSKWKKHKGEKFKKGHKKKKEEYSKKKEGGKKKKMKKMMKKKKKG